MFHSRCTKQHTNLRSLNQKVLNQLLTSKTVREETNVGYCGVKCGSAHKQYYVTLRLLMCFFIVWGWSIATRTATQLLQIDCATLNYEILFAILCLTFFNVTKLQSMAAWWLRLIKQIGSDKNDALQHPSQEKVSLNSVHLNLKRIHRGLCPLCHPYTWGMLAGKIMWNFLIWHGTLAVYCPFRHSAA